MILNSRNIENEEALVKKARWKRSAARSCLFFREAHPFRKRKPRAKTVIEALPDSEMAGAYRKTG
ncbi:MAG: hypothetical protein ACLR2E_04315 [Lachnospiraceae bacterium]